MADGGAHGHLTHRGVVYPWDCDHMGHMNVRMYVHHFDQALYVLLAEVGLGREYLKERERRLAGVDQHVQYKRELFPGDVFQIRSRFTQLGRTSLTISHRMESLAGELIATCDVVGVHLDARSGRPAELPEDVRTRISESREGVAGGPPHGD